MNLPIRFLPEARDEFDAAADWYEQKRLDSESTSWRAREVLDRIAANPALHAVVYQDVRKGVVRQFPYIMLYREDQGEIIVISVFATARDPSIWQSRV
jgi:plasmid stabilization system protein ParE